MKKILLITDTLPYPVCAGNKKRINDFFQLFINKGHQVDVLFVRVPGYSDKTIDEFKAFYKKLGVNTIYEVDGISAKALAFQARIRKWFFKLFKLVYNYNVDAWYCNQITRKIRQINNEKKHYYDVVWVEYVMYSKALLEFESSVIKVIDTHDCFSNRGEMYKQNGLVPTWFFCNAKEEARGLNRADVVIAIQENEEKYFKSILRQGVKTISIGSFMDIVEAEGSYNVDRLLFVGSDNVLNVTAIINFIDNIFPIIKQVVPSCELCLCGNVCNKLPESDLYKKLGFVEDIDKLYASTKVVICPTITGTGQHIKCMEALFHSKAVVTTEASGRGISYQGTRPFVIAPLDNTFAEAVIDFLTDEKKREKYEQLAYNFAIATNNIEQSKIDEVLNLCK